MTIDELLNRAREIWGPSQLLAIDEVIVPMGVIFGDICRWRRDRNIAVSIGISRVELQKELGNMIFSTIRWCDDLGLDPKECIGRAIHCQELYVASRGKV